MRAALLPVDLRALACALLLTVSASPARAALEDGDGEAERPLPKDDPFAVKPGYGQLFGSVMLGDGLRFNNPYRLRTPLGADAESVARTAAYVDLGLGVTLGNPLGFQHGASFRTSVAIEGLGQSVITPSYLLWRRKGALAAYGRAGVAVVVTPDVTWGFEGAAGGAWFLLGGIGVAAEVVGNVFYGTGTRDVAIAAYPMLAGQIGLLGTYEVLP
jgi:hypothetical protein